MIYEYALEPELVASWHDRKEFLFFEEKFGIRTKRIVSAFPKKWKRLVWEAFVEGGHGQDVNARKRLEALLASLCKNMVKRASSFPEIKNWLERAEAEHAERPFHAIVARQNPRAYDYVITPGTLVVNGHDKWQVPDNSPVPRTATGLVEAVAPVLRVCRQIVFIDPYFDPAKERFLKPMAYFLDVIWNSRYGVGKPQVELHTSIDRFFRKKERGPERDPEEERRVCEKILSDLQEKLSRIIPRGEKMSVFIWKQRELGENLHNRYILTEVCGVLFGTGLDQSDDPEAMETDDVVPLYGSLLDSRWKQYKGSPAAFDSVVEPFELVGD